MKIIFIIMQYHYYYCYYEIHEFHILELRIEMIVYVRRNFIALLKAEWRESRPEICVHPHPSSTALSSTHITTNSQLP